MGAITTQWKVIEAYFFFHPKMKVQALNADCPGSNGPSRTLFSGLGKIGQNAQKWLAQAIYTI